MYMSMKLFDASICLLGKRLTEIVLVKTLQPLLHLTLHTTRLSHICDIYYPCVTHKLCDTTLAYLGKIFVVWVRTGDVGIAALFFS